MEYYDKLREKYDEKNFKQDSLKNFREEGKMKLHLIFIK